MQEMRQVMTSEHQEQAALIRWANMSTRQYPELRWLFAVPNAAKRSPRLAAMMKAEGLKAGVPDLLLPVARGGYTGLAIELKSHKGRLSGAQEEWLKGLAGLGWKAEVCRGWVFARGIIEDYLRGKNEN